MRKVFIVLGTPLRALTGAALTIMGFPLWLLCPDVYRAGTLSKIWREFVWRGEMDGDDDAGTWA